MFPNRDRQGAVLHGFDVFFRGPDIAMCRLRDVSASCVHVDRIDRLAGGHEETVAMSAAETNVGADFGKQNQSDPLAFRAEDVDTVIARSHPSTASPDVAVHVGTNAVSHPGF